MRSPRPIRNVDAGDLVEMMLVVAVVTIIIIRVILELSGYPKLAGGGLHIAHVLYGGLLMILALIVRFAFLNIAASWIAAFIGGVGFGFFIDEVGKFITSDVNYFFTPAFSVMYVVFIVLFMSASAIRRARLRPHDALANALSLLREERDGALDAETKRDILSLLGKANPADPLVPVLGEHVRDTVTIEGGNAHAYALVRTRLAEWYRGIVGRRWFTWIILTVMILGALADLSLLANPFFDADDTGVDDHSHDWAMWFEAASAGVTAVLTIIGLVAWYRSRVTALRFFKASVLVALLITQVFVFYYDQLEALTGVIYFLLLYAGLSYAIAQEEARERDDATASAVASATPASALAPKVS